MVNNNGKYKINNEHRFTKLEGVVDGLVKDVSEIRDNHLLHLKQDIKSATDDIAGIKLSLARWGGIIIGVGTIIQVLIKIYL